MRIQDEMFHPRTNVMRFFSIFLLALSLASTQWMVQVQALLPKSSLTTTRAIQKQHSLFHSENIPASLDDLPTPQSRCNCNCRSNATHIAWRVKRKSNVESSSALASSSRQLQPSADTSELNSVDGAIPVQELDCPFDIMWMTISEAQRMAYQYLRSNVMLFDVPFLETLGFVKDDNAADLPDGLSGGLIGPTIHYALQAKIEFAYTDELPLEIWREYVLNYANANEARSNWRPLLWKVLRPLSSSTTNNDTIASVVRKVNQHMWTLLAPKGQDSIRFVAGQTPLIFDPMSVLVFGTASCTGCAILFINALRTLGVPARLVGTPAWHNQRSQGNHNWVEVWQPTTMNATSDYGGTWTILEPTLPPSTDPDNLERDPCTRWFCHPDRFSSTNATHVFAARLDRSAAETYYPLSWEWNNRDVMGDNVTERYYHICSQCK
jgi:hypothetical protein